MKIEKISINGEIFDANTGSISVLDAGFTYGFSVFETFRVSEKKFFLLDEHLDRLYSSLDYLKIKRPAKKGLAAQLSQVINEFGLHDDLFVRLMISAGDGDLKLSPQNYDKPNITIYASKIDKFSSLEKSAKILVSANRQIPEYFPVIKTRLKTASYTSARLAQAELDDFRAENNIGGRLEGILLSPGGYVSEALTSNIFWVKDGLLYTPPLSLGILPGIIRNEIISSQKVSEKLITADDLVKADEVFLTNSVNYLSPINSVNNLAKPGASGDIYKRTYKILNTRVKNNSIHIHSYSSGRRNN